MQCYVPMHFREKKSLKGNNIYRKTVLGYDITYITSVCFCAKTQMVPQKINIKLITHTLRPC